MKERELANRLEPVRRQGYFNAYLRSLNGFKEASLRGDDFHREHYTRMAHRFGEKAGRDAAEIAQALDGKIQYVDDADP